MNNAVAERVEQAPVAAPPASNAAAIMEMIGQAAADPNTDVDKLERLLGMYERITAREAEKQFADAMVECQKEMEPISQDASNDQTKSKYASFTALDRAMRPIYTKHGFSLSFGTEESARENNVRVVCKTTHRSGHSEKSQFDAPADGKGAKGGDVMTKTHAAMSALSYGRRALLKMVFNIAEGRDTDDDGNAAGRADEVLSDDQVAELRKLIMETDTDLPALLAYIKQPRLEDVFANKFDLLKQIIRERRWEKKAS